MTTTINKVDDFLEAFLNKIVKHTGRPDYEVLNNIKTALKQNFATVPCTLGGGTHGYLGAIPLLAIDPVRINKKIFDRNEHERIL